MTATGQSAEHYLAPTAAEAWHALREAASDDGIVVSVDRPRGLDEHYRRWRDSHSGSLIGT